MLEVSAIGSSSKIGYDAYLSEIGNILHSSPITYDGGKDVIDCWLSLPPCHPLDFAIPSFSVTKKISESLYDFSGVFIVDITKEKFNEEVI